MFEKKKGRLIQSKIHFTIGGTTMTRKEFLTGTPFKIKGNDQIYKYDEQEGGELMQLVNNKFVYSVVVQTIASTFFQAYVIRIGDTVKKNYKINYEDLIKVEL